MYITAVHWILTITLNIGLQSSANHLLICEQSIVELDTFYCNRCVLAIDVNTLAIESSGASEIVTLEEADEQLMIEGNGGKRNEEQNLALIQSLRAEIDVLTMNRSRVYQMQIYIHFREIHE